MNFDILKPDYDNSILSIPSSFLKNYGLVPHYPTNEKLDEVMQHKYKNIVYLILDCMGTYVVESLLDENSFLRKNISANITTTFPSTTASATISLHTGYSPRETGWVGWMPYITEYNAAIEAFTGKNFYTKEKVCSPLAYSLLRYTTIYDRITKSNPNIHYHKVFPAKIVGNGAKDFNEFCMQIKHACKSEGENFISAYWDEPDHTIHNNGVVSYETQHIVQYINSKLEKLCDELDNTLVVITADHGAIDTRNILLNDIPGLCQCFSAPPSLESRFVTFRIKPDMTNTFKEIFNKHFSYDFLLYTKNEFIKANLLGKGKKHPRLDSYFGEFVAIAIANKNLLYKYKHYPIKNSVAEHAGLTKEEMLVPLIIIK